MTTARKLTGRGRPASQTSHASPPEDTMFPAPASPTGRVLAHLVSLEVPGTGIETSRAALARGARLDADDVATALRRLDQDGFILLEGSGDTVTVTVLLAPPLEEYGITPRWGAPATSEPTPTPPARPAGPPPAAPAANATRTSTASSKTAVAPATKAASKTSAPATKAIRPVEQPSQPAARTAPAAKTAQPARPAAKTSEPAAKTAQPAAKTAPAARAARKSTGPAVDETAVLRGFVERFESLLAELDEWKRRAQASEDRAATVEKLLRDAERRAQLAEQRLASVDERAQSLRDLTRRMQELARKADGPRTSRPRASKQ